MQNPKNRPGREKDPLQDADTFGKLYDRLFPKVFSYVSYRVGREQDAEDIVAETFLKAVNGIHQFEWRHEGSLDAWIFKIAQNLLKNFYRRNRGNEITLSSDELPRLKGDTLPPLDFIVQKERFLYLRELIGTLSPRHQDVITLKFFGGLRNQEIARILDLEERTVASYLCRGLNKLQERYSEAPAESDIRTRAKND